MKKLKILLFILIISLSFACSTSRLCPAYPPRGYDKEIKI